MRTKKMKRLLSLLLCLCMVAGLLPATALAVTPTGSVSATIYLDPDGDGSYTAADTRKTFAADQAGLNLYLDFGETCPSGLAEGSAVSSIAFYPVNAGEDEWGTVFWYSGSDNGTSFDKLYLTGRYNGVFRLENFTPNGVEPGTYKIMAYVGYNDGTTNQEKYFLSNETFEITAATGAGGSGGPGGPGGPVTPSGPVITTTTTLPTAYVREAYSQTLSATPGTAGSTLTWAVTKGSLPNGLTLSKDGVLSGTPTAAGSSTFTVQVSETVGEETLTATQELTLKVVEASASGWKLKECSVKFWLDSSKTGEPVSSFAVTDYLYMSADFGAGNTFGTAWAGGSHKAGLLSSNKDVTVDNALNFRDFYFEIGDYGSAGSGSTVFDSELTLTYPDFPGPGTYRFLIFEYSYQTVFYSKEVFTITEESTPVVDPFRFDLDNIDSDARGYFAYLRAKDTQNGEYITLWCGTLKEDTNSLPVYGAFAGATVSDVRLITYAFSSSGNTETVLADYSGSPTLADGQSVTLTGKGQNVLVKLPAISHRYGENANIRTWFEESTSGRTYQPGTLVAAESSFTLHASASSYGENDPLKECDLTTATFDGAGVSGTTYTPAENTNGEDIDVSYTKYDLPTVTVTLVPTTNGITLPDLSGARLSFSQSLNGWTYSTDAVVGTGNTCTVDLYTGMAGQVFMTNAGSYTLYSNAIADDSIQGNALELTVYGAKERSMAVLVAGKPANDNTDLAAYANKLSASVNLQAAIGDESWFTGSANLSTLLNGSSQFRLWNDSYRTNLSNLVTSGGTLKLSCVGSGPVVTSSKDITWTQNSLTGSAELPIHLRGGVLFDLSYAGSTRTGMYGWWHQNGTWVRGQSVTVHPSANTIAQYCPGDPGSWDFVLLPSRANPNGMAWDEVLNAYPVPNQTGITIANNTVHNLGELSMDKRDVDSLTYLTLPKSTFTGPQQFDTVNDTLVFTGHIELDAGADNKMRILRLDANNSSNSNKEMSTQISSVVINGKTYPYIGTRDPGSVKDMLTSAWNQTYYEIVFTTPMKLPCDITVYAKPTNAGSAAVLDMSVLLTDKNFYEPVNRVEVSAPSLSVDMPSTVGVKTFTAYVTIPGNGSVDVYDGVDLVGRADRTGDVKITLSGASDSVITSHKLRFVLRDGDGNETGTYTQTVLHANGAPTLRSQNLQTSANNGYSWVTRQRDTVYSFNSHSPLPFRMTAAFDHPENLKADSVVFVVRLLDGSIRYLKGTADSAKPDTFISEAITTSSPVIGSTVTFEIDWDKVNKNILTDLHSQTIVLEYDDIKDEIPTEIPGQLTKDEIAAIQNQIKEIYANNGGGANYYTIEGTGHSNDFLTGRYMFQNLDPSALPEGYTGGSTFTRRLSEEQLEIELGGGDWIHLIISGWPGGVIGGGGGEGGGGTGGGGTGTGGGDTSYVDVDIHLFTPTSDYVDGILTITEVGDDIFETGTATVDGTGTGGGTPTLPDPTTGGSGGGGGGGGGGGFGFTQFTGPSSMDVFSSYVDDASTINDLFNDLFGQGGGDNPIDDAFGKVSGVLSAAKSTLEGLSNDKDLQSLFNSVNSLLDSPCAGKLSPIIRANLQNQINNFNDMAVEAMQWNTVNTMAGTGSGVAGAMGIAASNPVTGVTVTIALWGTGKVTSQMIDNVKNEAQLIGDMVQMQIAKYARANNDPDCAPKARSTYRVNIDPSGIVYEAVLSNPVAGATVTLYTADGSYVPTYEKDTNGLEIYADENGKPIDPKNKNTYTGYGNLTAPDVNDLEPGVLTLTTGADGRYQWMVPAGLWYVTAEKGAAGYAPGSSQNDIAAVVTSTSGKNWLPVLPAQLDVNIPLVSYDIPTVTAEYRSDGVYLTFSKYMDNTTLTATDAFKIGTTAVNPENVVLLNSEQAPGNIKYVGDTPRYTSQVKLAATDLSGAVTVTIGSGVKSYAGVPCGATEGLTLTGTVSAATSVSTPTFSASGQVPYGSTVTISCRTEGAVLYYTTDGTEPTTDSTRYYPGQTIAIDRNMTIKVLAVKPGYTDATASASFTVPSDNNIYGGNGGGNSGTGGTTSGGSSGSTRYTVSAPEAVTGGSLTVSPKSASKGDTVTITVKPDKGYELDKLTVTDSKGNEVKLTEKNGKYTFTMPASGVSIKASFKPAEISNPFTDVVENAYYYDAVLWAAEKGITGGTTATTFSPNAPCTRAQIVTFLWRAAGSPEPKSMNSFADVSADAYYAKAVAWAIENGITGGVGDGKFAPDATCTRSQSAAFLYRAAGSPAVSGDAAFSDVSADAYYAAAVAWAAQNGITNGIGGGLFGSGNDCTRAQIVTFLYRAYQGEYRISVKQRG